VTNPFPNGVIEPFSSPPKGLANNLGISLQTVMHSQSTPTTYNFNFGLEYELPHQVVVSAGYVGSRGLYLPFGPNVDLNVLDLGTIAKYGASLCVTPSPSCMVPNPYQNLPGAFQGQATVPQWFVLQQYPQFGGGSYGSGNGVNVIGFPAGDSEYSSLQMKVQKRLTHHFTTLSTFTWGKLMTDDGKYQFTGQVSYDLPVGKGQRVNLNGVSNALLGGWTTNAIVYLSTGIPIPSPASGITPGYFNQRADLVCDSGSGFSRSVNQWVNNSCFTLPSSPFVPGTAPAYLDQVRTRGARDLDFSIYKTFSFGETKALRFDVSSYNLANWAQYGMPSRQDLTVSSGQPYGPITNTVNTPRQFQFGARFSF
jgi:hypothetical protein